MFYTVGGCFEYAVHIPQHTIHRPASAVHVSHHTTHIPTSISFDSSTIFILYNHFAFTTVVVATYSTFSNYHAHPFVAPLMVPFSSSSLTNVYHHDMHHHATATSLPRNGQFVDSFYSGPQANIAYLFPMVQIDASCFPDSGATNHFINAPPPHHHCIPYTSQC